MQFTRKVIFVLLSLLSIVSLVVAQEDCPAEIDDAIFALNDICLNTGRNQICYGNGDIVAIPQSGVTLDFAVPGDLAAVDEVESLSLSPYEVGFAEWGVAVLVLQADLPDTVPGQNVTMLLMGDVNFSNQGNAYYFTSGIGTPSCNQAPNGVLIQTPEGVGEVSLTMNGINITLGSTAYLGTLEEDILTFALLEGHSTLSIEGSDITLESEQFTSIELDEEGNATGEFTEAQAIEDLALPELPTSLLAEPIVAEDSTGDTASGDVIYPLNGTWLTTFGDFTFGDECPSFFNEAMVREAMTSSGYSGTTVSDMDFTDIADIETFFITPEFAAMGMDYRFSNPETNVYVMILNLGEDIGTFTYTWTVLSETYIEGEVVENLMFPGMGTCVITVSFVFEHQG